MSLTLPTESELSSYQIIARIASTNPYWRKLGGNGTPEEVSATILSVMLLARELGFSPMQAVSGGIHNVNGKFEISARLMNQAIRSRGHKMQQRAISDQFCTLWGKRKDTGEEMEVSYHIEEAIRAGLVKENGPWKKIPQDMLFARAISRLARRLYPDCIGSCYIEGELQESIQGKVIETIEVPTQEEFHAELPPLELPEGVDKDRVEEFLLEISDKMKKPLDFLRNRAASNLEEFLVKFREWESHKS